MPALMPKRLPRLIEVSAQWSVSDEDSRIAVLTPATDSGSSVPAVGHGLWLTTPMKKYAVKNAPKIITSETMNSSIPSVGAWTREDWCACGGPWWDPVSAWAIEAASIRVSSSLGAGAHRVAVDHVLDVPTGGVAHALDEVRPQPARLGVGECRDDDVVHLEVLQRVHDRGVGIGVPDHPGAGQPLVAQAPEHERQ